MARKNPSPRLIAWRTREFVNLALTHLHALYGTEFVLVPLSDIEKLKSVRRMVTIAPANKVMCDAGFTLTEIAHHMDALCGNDPDVVREFFEEAGGHE